MNRRSFIAYLSAAALYPYPNHHLIFVVYAGGARKKDYYEDASLARNVRRLARDGVVFEEEHCEQVASHDAAFDQLTQELKPTCVVESVREIPKVLEQRRPRVLVVREMAHDIGHESFERYLGAVRKTDDEIGLIFDWIKSHPEFRNNTSVAIRPVFGRDDEVNSNGELHHSYGFYYTHRVASIFWGPVILGEVS